MGTKACYVDDYKVKEPLSGYDIQAEWMTSVVIQKAKDAGMQKLYYADLRVVTYLFGIYTNKTLIVYGD